jgi:putative component of membrane protein insertase Oxa1/YidC/SpoIIIJ protein YidD
MRSSAPLANQLLNIERLLVAYPLVFGVNFYQRFISPYKGYVCSHRVLHGKASCSQYVKEVLLQNNILTAVKLSKRRFSDCQSAYITLNRDGFIGQIGGIQPLKALHCACCGTGGGC